MDVDRWTTRAFAIALLVLAAALLAAPGSRAESEEGSSALGRITYRSYCTSCHGESGRGDGTLAASLDPAPTDLTVLAQRNAGVYPAERVRAVIDGREPVPGHGEGQMPEWAKALAAASEDGDEAAVARTISNLVAYLKTIQREGGEG
jgi:mono/diheme cytochrome c family protein